MRRAAAFSAIWRALTASKSGPALGQRLVALPRMFWYTVTGRYDGFGRLFAISLATLYVASPIDLFPEAVLLLPGLLDDAVIAVWIAGAVLSETERFLLWEQGRSGASQTKPASVIDGDVA
jgi:uncharacterized membrane protein YkvA (DUF1232 family)